MLQGILAFEWLGLSGNAWFTIVVVLLLFAAMIFSKLRVDIIFLLGMCALYLSGVLDLKTAFGGFSSASVIIIAVLYAVIAGLNYTGVLNWVVKHMMGSPKTVSRAILRTMFPVALLSSFLTNTTVVALFILATPPDWVVPVPCSARPRTLSFQGSTRTGQEPRWEFSLPPLSDCSALW